MRKIYFLLFLILITQKNTLGQNQFSNLSPYERSWALKNPVAAIKAKKRLKAALSIVEEVKKEKLLDQFENGGKLDAFRHVFSMAYLSQKIPVKKLRALGIAHEKGNRLEFLNGKLEHGELPDSVSCEMDLRNNDIGFELGTKFKKVDTDSLKNMVIAKIRNGNTWIIKRDSNGEYMRCDDSVLVISEWKNKWEIPKCLVKSK